VQDLLTDFLPAVLPLPRPDMLAIVPKDRHWEREALMSDNFEYVDFHFCRGDVRLVILHARGLQPTTCCSKTVVEAMAVILR
jgi:hypothetical protein